MIIQNLMNKNTSHELNYASSFEKLLFKIYCYNKRLLYKNAEKRPVLQRDENHAQIL